MTNNHACVAEAVRAYATKLSDAAWSSPSARAAGLLRLASAQLGSAGVIDEELFASRLAEQARRRILPILLRSWAEEFSAQREALELSAARCERDMGRAFIGTATGAAHAAAALVIIVAEDAGPGAECDRILSLGAEIAIEALRECGLPGRGEEQ